MLDPKVVISQLNTEWNQRQGLTPTGKESNIVFQTSRRTLLQCENCNKTGHTKTKCWAKGGGQEGQYPNWFKGRKGPNHNTVKTITNIPIVWMYSSNKNLEAWIADSTATVHVSPNQEDFDSYHKYDKNQIIKVLEITQLKGLVKEIS